MSVFALALKGRMDRLGIECIARLREDLPELPVEEVGSRFERELAEFIIGQLAELSPAD